MSGRHTHRKDKNMTLEESRLEKIEELIQELKKTSSTTKRQEQIQALEWLVYDKYLQLDLQKHCCR